MQPSVNYDIQFVGKVKTALFGGEGLFFATLTGPGTGVAAVAAAESVWPTASTRPFPALAAAARKKARSSAVSGNLLDGD